MKTGKMLRRKSKMKKRTVSIFLWFILPYILVLLATLGLEQRIYRKSVEILGEETMQLQLSTLENSMYLVDGMITDAENISVELSLEPKYRLALLKLKKSTDNFYDYIDVWKTLNSANFNKDFILDYIIYFPEADFLLTSKTASVTPELYYEDQICYGNMDFQQWKNFLSHAESRGKIYPAQNVKLYNQNERVLSYVRALPFDLKKPEAVLQIFIRERTIQDAFDDYARENQGMIVLAGPDGTMLAVKGDFDQRQCLPDGISFNQDSDYQYLEPCAGQRWGDYLVYVTSEKTGLTYLSVLPEELTLHKVIEVKLEILAVTGMLLLVIITLGCLVSRLNLQSVEDIYSKLSGFGGGRKGISSAYTDINENLDSLLASHDRLSASFQKQASRIISGMTKELLQGTMSNVEEVLNMVEEIGITVRTEHYCTAIFKILKTDDPYLQKQTLESIILSQSQNDVLVTDYAQNRVAVLFCENESPEAFAELTEKRMQQCADKIRERGIQAFCVIGPTVDSVADVQNSTAAAVRILPNILFDGSRMVYSYDRMQRNYDNSFYSAELEQKLIHMVRQGKKEDVLDFLEKLIADHCASEENVLKRKSVYLRLGATLEKIQGGNIWYTAFYKALEQSNDESTIVNELKSRYMELTEEYLSQKKNSNEKMILEIQKYIRENYMNASLCLADIAEKFNISEVYFSQTFKAVTDENFSTYLEKLRMEEARKLLHGTDKTVEEVAEMVGYNSINTFHKAFKRVNGITPGAFKKLK